MTEVKGRRSPIGSHDSILRAGQTLSIWNCFSNFTSLPISICKSISGTCADLPLRLSLQNHFFPLSFLLHYFKSSFPLLDPLPPGPPTILPPPVPGFSPFSSAIDFLETYSSSSSTPPFYSLYLLFFISAAISWLRSILLHFSNFDFSQIWFPIAIFFGYFSVKSFKSSSIWLGGLGTG